MGKVTEKLKALVDSLDKVKQLDKSAVERQARVDEAMHREAETLKRQKGQPSPKGE